MRPATTASPRQRAVMERAVFLVLRPVVALLFRLRVHGRVPQDGPVIVAANHVSYLDPVVLAVLLYGQGRSPRFLTVQRVFDLPLVGAVVRRTGLIPVGRRGGLQAFRAAAAALGEGELVVIYPEGHIALPGVEHRPRAGVALLSRLTGAPVVPVASAGMEPAGRLLGWLRRRPAAVVIGAPLAVPAAGDHQAAGAVLAAVRALRPRAEALARGRDFPHLEDGASAAGP